MKSLFQAIEEYKLVKTCSLCNKQCKNKRGCLIGQIVNQVNFERIGTKYKPVSFITVSMKLKHLGDDDIAYSLSVCSKSKVFSRCFWGSLKLK